MKKAFSKSLSWLLSVVMIFGIFVVGDLTEVNATGSITTQDIQRVLDKYGYTTGSYWTMWDYPNYGGSDCGATVQTINSELYASSNPATSSSSNVQSWKSYNFNNAWQCHGFALYVMSKVTGNTVSSAGGTNWTKITSKPSYLQIGDIIRTTQHTAVVLTADNGRYTFAECWGSSQNKISIGKGFNYYYYTLDSITSNDTFQYVLRYGGSPVPIDTVAPSISYARAENVSKDSFELVCDLSDNIGVTRVWLIIYAPNGETQFGVPASNGEFRYTIKTSEYGGEGEYAVGFYAFDATENGTKGLVENINDISDTIAPSINNARAENVSKDSFELVCDLSDNVGVTRVWLIIYAPNGETQFGVPASNGEFRYTIKTSEYGGEGEYAVGFYTFDAAENGILCTVNGIKAYVDYSISPTSKADYNGHTYEYYDYPLKWFDAYRFCEKKGGHLVTITSKEEDDFISGLVKDYSVWTGGRTFDNSPWMWITGESFDYQNWGWNQPDNYNNSEDALQYVFDQGTIYWNDAPGNTTLTFICEYDNAIDISKYTPVYKENYNGHEYWYFENRVDWQTAKKICELKGGYLAIPNDADENAMIISGLKNTSNELVWIGITDIENEDVWKDAKGNIIQYTNWSYPQPDNYGGREDYVHMYNDGTWNDANCGCNCCNNVGFVCEFDDLCTGSGHKYEETIVAPTTAEQGYTLHTCSVCKHSYKDNYTNILLSNNSTLSAETIKLGETITATAKATGGTGEYLYQVVYKQTTQSKWTTAQSYKANTTVTFKPANAVTYDVCVKVKDSNNTEVKKFFTVKVTSDELKNVSTISAQTINLGSTVTVNAKATGSTGFYTYAVYYKQKAQTKWTTKQDFKANNTIAVKPAKATTYDICVKVKDDKGTIVKKYFTVNVTDFTNTSTLSATEIKLGNTVKVSCSATGSTGYYQYAVYYKKTSDTKWTTKQSYSSNNTVTIKPAKATTYDVCVKVKDNQNNEVKKYFTVTVK